MRWCVCSGFRSVDCPVPVDVLMHRREYLRPTSTGRLIHRVMSGSRLHVHGDGTSLSREALVRSERTLWILHPGGELPPSTVESGGSQILVLDGSWSEAARMRRVVEPWGQCIRLPADLPPSRYGLRKSPAPGMYSTVEALGMLLEMLGLGDAATQLRIQFELHVYAGLRSRGAVVAAEKFLEESLLPRELPGCLSALTERRRLGKGPLNPDGNEA
jgi:DTW domain-containing protein YfiP